MGYYSMDPPPAQPPPSNEPSPPANESPPSEPDSPPSGAEDGGAIGDVGSLLNAAMLDVGSDGSLGAIIGSDVYDGNIPIASDLSSALDTTLDLLTTTSSLFDVPALDILGGDGLDS